MARVRWVAGGDLHGDECDHLAVSAFRMFCKEWNLKTKILIGDIFDFSAIRKNARREERANGISKDVRIGTEFMEWLQPDIWTLGNHDQRLWDVAKNSVNGMERDCAREGVQDLETLCDNIGCHTFPYSKNKGIYQQGDTKFFHGFHYGISAARKHASVFGKSVSGHTHSMNVGVYEKHGEYAKNYESGCLCKEEMEYDRHQTAGFRHEHGFCYGIYNDKTGENVIWQSRKMNGIWIFPSEMTFCRIPQSGQQD